MTIKEATKPEHYLINVNGQEIETKYIMESLADEAALVGSKAIWYGNAFKYIFRMFKKHSDPAKDISKAIVSLINLLEKFTGKKYKFEEVEEDFRKEISG